MRALAQPAWGGEWSDQNGLQIRINHAHQSAEIAAHSKDAAVKGTGNVAGDTVRMFDTAGTLSSDGQVIDWANGATWTRSRGCASRPDRGGCSRLTCATICSQSPWLRAMLDDLSMGCADFFPDGVVRAMRGPCRMSATCPDGMVLRERECQEKHQSTVWDVFISRTHLLQSFLSRASPTIECGASRVALFSLSDYSDVHERKFFANRTVLRELSSRCIAPLTWEANLPMRPAGQRSTAQDPAAILIPDAYFLMTRGYTRSPRYFNGRFVETRDSIAAVGESSPWVAKRSAVAWRGTPTSDASGDRERLVKGAAALRDDGRFTAQQLDVEWTPRNCSHASPEGSCQRYLSPAEMMQSRGILSVDGVGNEWTLVWKLLCNSVLLLVQSRRVWEWYYPWLVPWKHFVPVRNDLSDLEESVAFVLDPKNDDALRAMAAASTELMAAMNYTSAAREVQPQLQAAFDGAQQ